MVFNDASELYKCIGGLFAKGAQHEVMGPKVKASNIIIRFNYTQPEASLTIDTQSTPPEGQYFNVIHGDNDLKADVVMSMTSDVAHQFWLGKVNLTLALSRGQMVAQGPIQSIMRLLPVIKPAYELYPQHLHEIGFDHLLPEGN